VTQRLRPGGADAGVLVLPADDLLGALGLDPRQGQLLAHDLRQLGQRHLELGHVLAGPIAGRALPRRPLPGLTADRVAGIAVALANAALLLVAPLEARQVDLRQRDRDLVAALLGPIISPCEMYLRRFCLILPRMIWRKRP
jgi:hypothetical protein